MELPTWAVKLATLNWQKKKQKILNSDLWQCQGCGSTEKPLEVHHIDYWDFREPDQYDGKMLQSLCRECHEFEQKRLEIERNLFNSLRYQKWTIADVYAFSTYMHRYPAFSVQVKKLISEYINDDL